MGDVLSGACQKPPRPSKATAAHERWQLDFKMRIALADGSYVHLFTACDEGTGATTVAYPELDKPRRPFQPTQELATFDLARVDAFLATFTWRRRARKTGHVVIGQQRCYSIGRQHGGQEVLVRFDPSDRHFVFYDAVNPDQLLARRPARGLALADILDIAPWPVGIGCQQLPLPLVFAKG